MCVYDLIVRIKFVGKKGGKGGGDEMLVVFESAYRTKPNVINLWYLNYVMGIMVLHSLSPFKDKVGTS